MISLKLNIYYNNVRIFLEIIVYFNMKFYILLHLRDNLFLICSNIVFGILYRNHRLEFISNDLYQNNFNSNYNYSFILY